MGKYSKEELRVIHRLNGFHMNVDKGLDADSLKKVYVKVCHIKTEGMSIEVQAMKQLEREAIKGFIDD